MNSSALPCQSFVPDLVTALVTHASASPNSEENRLIRTWTSLIDSSPYPD
jgi:hypothetical protein